jgi:hypothetical protein
MNIVSFDVISFFWNWSSNPFWGFNGDIDVPVSFQMQNVGYNNRNLFSALGTLSFLIAFYFIRMCLAGFIKSYIVLRK